MILPVMLACAIWPRFGRATSLTENLFLSRARPLIEDALARQTKEFGVDLRPDPFSWRLSYPTLDKVMDAFALTHPFYFPGANGLVSPSCRTVSVDLPARAARATFFVERDGSDHLRLVGSCRSLRDPSPRLRLESIGTRGRAFGKREFAARAMPLVQRYLEASRPGARIDWSSVRLRRGRGWFAELTRDPRAVCRAFEVLVDGRRRRVFVAVREGAGDFIDQIPPARQSLLKDPSTLKTYRFAVVRGCADDDQVRPPVVDELVPH